MVEDVGIFWRDWLRFSGASESVGDVVCDWFLDSGKEKTLTAKGASGGAVSSGVAAGGVAAGGVAAGGGAVGKSLAGKESVGKSLAGKESVGKNWIGKEAALGEGGCDARDMLRAKMAGCGDLSAVAEVLRHEKPGVLREIQNGASNLVYTDGVAHADVLVIGEAPGRDEDRLGLPFVGKSGQLLDKILQTIGLSRQSQVLFTNVVYWRPPGNRNPSSSEVMACSPVVEKTIELVDPKLILLTGAVPTKALLQLDMPMARIRGKPQTYVLATTQKSYDVLVTFHPSYLLRDPSVKAHVWRDMLTLEAMLGGVHTKDGEHANI